MPLGSSKVYILSCVSPIRTTLFKRFEDSDNGSIGASQPDLTELCSGTLAFPFLLRQTLFFTLVVLYQSLIINILKKKLSREN